MIKNNWYVITGAPCSGKSTILFLLKNKGYYVVEEAARVYIDQEMAKGRTLEEIRKNEYAFQKKVLQIKINNEKKLSKDKLIIFERGIPDSIAYFKLCGVNKNYYFEEIIKKCSYRKIFLFELLDYQIDYARTEDKERANHLEKLLEESYQYINAPVIKIPKMSIEKRLEIILSHIN